MVSEKVKILIVEDEAVLGEMLERSFQEEGFTVRVVRSGKEGIEMARSFHPHLILLDILLPDIDGYAVIQILKDDATTRDIKVVLLSNLADVEDMERALSLGATKYLVKSDYTPKQIKERVKQILEEYDEEFKI